MKIGIDGRLWNQKGIGRYIRNLVLNLLLIDKKNSYVLFVRKEDENEIKTQISKLKIKNLKLKIVLANFKWHSLSEQIRFPKLINAQNVDLMHFPYQQSVPIFYKRPFVITIHDLIRHHFITGRSSTNPYWLLGFKMLAYKFSINIAAKNAKKIIAVSQTTKNEIIDHLMVNKGNVDVVYESADDFNSLDATKPEINNYFLYVGNVYAHKNAEKLIQAFKKVLEEKQVKLVFVGSEDYFYKRLKNENSKLVSQKRIIFLENVSDEDLAGYYKNAICLIRPSFMEGFSLPPLEAMANNCLVLASDIPVHREVFGESIIYFNPNDIVDIESKMNYVLSLNTKSMDKLKRLGQVVVGKYSWKKSALQTLDIYESCSSKN